MKTVLGIDYGNRFTGISVATTPIAEPLKTVPTATLDADLEHLISRYHPELIIVGLPENKMGRIIKLKASELSQKFHLPVILQDETLTSQETRKKLATSGKKKSVKEAKIDHYVAAVILQDYLDNQK
jgi:putative holliday junction resolvase